jgi:hypothetical protein
MKRILWSLALGTISALALSAGALVPGPTDSNPDTNFTFTVNTNTGAEFLSTPSGPDRLTVSGVGDLFATDNGSPGSVILALDLGVTQAVVLNFNIGGLSTDASNNVFIPATGAPGGTITDAGLAALIGNSTFEFAPAGSGGDGIFVFDFTAASLADNTVPEPAVSLMVGIGLLGISALRLRKRSN